MTISASSRSPSDSPCSAASSPAPSAAGAPRGCARPRPFGASHERRDRGHTDRDIRHRCTERNTMYTLENVSKTYTRSTPQDHGTEGREPHDRRRASSSRSRVRPAAASRRCCRCSGALDRPTSGRVALGDAELSHLPDGRLAASARRRSGSSSRASTSSRRSPRRRTSRRRSHRSACRATSVGGGRSTRSSLGRARRPRRARARRAVGRSAAARRHRPRARQGARRAPRRRAHGQPRRGDARRDHGPARGALARPRAHARSS